MAVILLVVCALAACLAPVVRVAADEFSWELSAAVDESERDEFESQGAFLAGTYYFDPVDDANGPYALASFLDPATRMSLVLSESEYASDATYYGTGFTLPSLFESETSEYALSGRYLLPQSKWYFGGLYAQGDVDEPVDELVVSTNRERAGLAVGKYLGAATTLELSFERSEDDSEQPFVVCLPGFCVTAGTLAFEATDDTVSLDAMHVRRFGSLTYSLFGGIAERNAEAVIRVPELAFPLPIPPPPFGVPPVVIPARVTEIELEPLRRYSVGGELFPTAKFGVRLRYTRFDGNDFDDDGYELSTTWFFRRNVGLRFTFSRQEGGDFGATEGVGLRVIGRL